MNDSVSSRTLLTARDPTVVARRQRRRDFTDVLTRRVVGVGGVGIIIAVLLIAFYLLWVVLPLFSPARLHPLASYPVPGGPERTLQLALDEQNEVGVRVIGDGRVVFFQASTGQLLGEAPLPHPPDVQITAFAPGDPAHSHYAVGFSNGTALLFTVRFEVSYTGSGRTTTPRLDYPFGEDSVVVDSQGQGLLRLATDSEEDHATLVAATTDGRLLEAQITRRENLMGDVQTEQDVRLLEPAAVFPRFLSYSLAQHFLYSIDADGLATVYDLGSGGGVVERLHLTPSGVVPTAVRLLLGGYSLLVGGADGSLGQWFPVRDSNNRYHLTAIRHFDPLPGKIRSVVPSQRMKGFVALDDTGHLGLYHATAHRTLLVEQVTPAALDRAALSPRGNGALWLDDKGQMQFSRLDNEHPEVSWSSLWEKVWYEGRSQPEYLWQSSASTNDFEPKMSLVPLTLGTLKASFYAMLVAIPLGVLGAVYTAYFMAPRMRGVVKPMVEIMGAVPSVILGFLAGLWLAPLVEQDLPGVFALLVLLPIFVVAASWGWSRLPRAVRSRIPEGWEAAFLVPVLLTAIGLAMVLSDPLEAWLFGGDARHWLTAHGVNFNQRNSLVVGIAMGFAVAPPIFTIAEDAVFAVPRHLTLGSLALGATPWQTVVRVVLLTASPGIFSAVMIGLGRAVGETMIVLMATGNTPVLDFNLFEGFRALSANIAVEMPESELNSTHYRVLFLTGLVLFLFTFVLNTLAELVRQRLRRKYSSL